MQPYALVEARRSRISEIVRHNFEVELLRIEKRGFEGVQHLFGVGEFGRRNHDFVVRVEPTIVPLGRGNGQVVLAVPPLHVVLTQVDHVLDLAGLAGLIRRVELVYVHGFWLREVTPIAGEDLPLGVVLHASRGHEARKVVSNQHIVQGHAAAADVVSEAEPHAGRRFLGRSVAQVALAIHADYLARGLDPCGVARVDCGLLVAHF